MKRLVMALMLLSTAVLAGCVTVQPPVHLDSLTGRTNPQASAS